MAGDLMAADLRTMNLKPSLETRMTELLSSAAVSSSAAAAAAAAAAGSAIASRTRKKQQMAVVRGSIKVETLYGDPPLAG